MTSQLSLLTNCNSSLLTNKQQLAAASAVAFAAAPAAEASKQKRQSRSVEAEASKQKRRRHWAFISKIFDIAVLIDLVFKGRHINTRRLYAAIQVVKIHV